MNCTPTTNYPFSRYVVPSPGIREMRRGEAFAGITGLTPLGVQMLRPYNGYEELGAMNCTPTKGLISEVRTIEQPRLPRLGVHRHGSRLCWNNVTKYASR